MFSNSFFVLKINFRLVKISVKSEGVIAIIYCFFIKLKGQDNGAKPMSIVQLVGVTNIFNITLKLLGNTFDTFAACCNPSSKNDHSKNPFFCDNNTNIASLNEWVFNHYVINKLFGILMYW